MKKTILFLAISCGLSGQIQRVEPAFWWKGMHNPELQILLYGKNISADEVSLSGGVQIKDLTKTENPNYLFLTVNTAEIASDHFKITLKKGGKTDADYDYKLKNREPGSAERESFSSKDVLYLIMPDRFANGDYANDNIPNYPEKANRADPNGRHGGDIRGVINHLNYIQNLGATAVWLTPVCEDNEPKITYHGYAQTDLYKIDPRYGSNEEYKNLSGELQKRHMKLVMDYVTNHWGISHWMMKDLPTKSWIHTQGTAQNGFFRSNYKTSTQFDPHASDIDKKEALDGWFDTSMPDINQSNPLVLKYLTQNAIWWIEYANLDGLRVDTYPYNDKVAMAKWAKAITDEYPNFNIVGETWLSSDAQIAAWQRNSAVAAAVGYNSYLPSVMDFTLFFGLPAAFKEKQENGDTGMSKIYNIFSDDFIYPDLKNILVFFENHDTTRWNEIFNDNPAYYKMALTLIATVRGIPQIYYGSEIGMRGEKQKGDGDIRRDFPGGWKGDAQNAFSLRTAEQGEFYNFTSKLLNWRKNKSVIHSGKMKHYLPENGVYTYFRYNDKESVMVVINNSEKNETLDIGRFAESLQGYNKAKDVITDKIFSVKNGEKWTVPAKSSLILELQ